MGVIALIAVTLLIRDFIALLGTSYHLYALCNSYLLLALTFPAMSHLATHSGSKLYVV